MRCSSPSRFAHAVGCILAAGLSGCVSGPPNASPGDAPVRVTRLLDAPIVTPASHPSIGENIQGPSLIRVPDWVAAPLGHYYLYFAAHTGRCIRLAYADALIGPWRVHAPGSLHLEDSPFPSTPLESPPGAIERVRAHYEAAGVRVPHDIAMDLTTPHIASPDVHVDAGNQRIVMYYHGLEAFGQQVTRVAVSKDGLHFDAHREILGRSYWRAFAHAGDVYALAMPGHFYRSASALGGFEEGPRLFDDSMRHSALVVRGDTLHVFWTRVGDAPEAILHSTIDVSKPWAEWSEQGGAAVLKPERSWEGAGAPVLPSMRSVAYGRVHQLRDPAIYEEDGRTYLLYAVAGESGIAIAEVHFQPDP